ncbi:hypothetical protein VCHA29O37_260031 [Vibrio chagasii]|nr:hypothetical protein VCHA29O37_260031 [Vibrio chagasii]
MNIVCAEKQELAEIYQLEHALFGDHAYPQFFIRQAFDCWGKGLLVAKQDSKIAGYALTTTTDTQNEFWVLSLAVDPNYRGMGIGRKLMQHAVEQLPRDARLLL